SSSDLRGIPAHWRTSWAWATKATWIGASRCCRKAKTRYSMRIQAPLKGRQLSSEVAADSSRRPSISACGRECLRQEAWPHSARLRQWSADVGEQGTNGAVGIFCRAVLTTLQARS